MFPRCFSRQSLSGIPGGSLFNLAARQIGAGSRGMGFTERARTGKDLSVQMEWRSITLEGFVAGIGAWRLLFRTVQGRSASEVSFSGEWKDTKILH